MTHPGPREEWTDLECLEALDLRDHEGLSAQRIAARLGRSRSAVCGILNRIDKHSNRADPDGRQNGTMPRRWWAAASLMAIGERE
jgi:hypothetical protein